MKRDSTIRTLLRVVGIVMMLEASIGRSTYNLIRGNYHFRPTLFLLGSFLCIATFMKRGKHDDS